jgi:hypothetical protein
VELPVDKTVVKQSIAEKVMARMEEEIAKGSENTKVIGTANKYKVIEAKKPTEPVVDKPKDLDVTVSDIPQDLITEKKSDEKTESVEESEPTVITKEAFIKQRLEYQAKLAKVEAMAKKSNEVSDLEKQLREELAATRKRLAGYSLLEDEEFIEKYEKPLQESYQQIITIVKSLDGDEAIVNTALRLGYKERIKYLNEKLPEATALILPMMAQLDTLGNTRTRAIENYESEKNKLKQSKFEREKRYQDELQGNSFSAALKNLTENDRQVFLLKSQSDQKWNDVVQQRIDLAKKMLGDNDPYLKSEMALRAVISDDYRNAYNKAQERVSELEKELGIRSKMRSGGSTGGSSSSEPKTDKDSLKPMTGKEIARLVTKHLR